QRHSFFVLATSSTHDAYHANLNIAALSRAGKADAARKLFDEMPIKDVVTWNSMLSAYWQNGLLQRSKALFHSMPLRNVVSWNSIIAACVQNDDVRVSWNIIITGYAQNGRGEEALNLFESMNLFSLMVHNYGIPPRSEHYACLVEVLSRAGQLQRACKIINDMPFKADSSIWGAVLAACSVHLNVELGELAARIILNLDPFNPDAYVMLSNIYAAAGNWKHAHRIRVLMKEKGVKKQTAYSWLQIGNKTHCFVGGDPSHPNINDIHVALRRITLHMKVKGNYEEIFL
ncbi:Pentatricopeptide repeat-containing protein, partial [Glycine soja]